jgi:PAS domain S-box-containing protein
MPDGTTILDEDDLIHCVNELLTIAGYQQGELIGQNISVLVPDHHWNA